MIYIFPVIRLGERNRLVGSPLLCSSLHFDGLRRVLFFMHSITAPSDFFKVSLGQRCRFSGEIVVESEGVKYNIHLGGNSGGVKRQIGDVGKIGNRVLILYKGKEKLPDGSYFLKVTSVVQIK